MEAERYSDKFKTQLCIKFMYGTCHLGAKCNYAHGSSELRETPRLCRMFSSNRHCSFGKDCRFVHSTPHYQNSAAINITPQQQQGTVQNAGSWTMQSGAPPPAAINAGSSSAQNKMVQTSTVPATNDPASSSTVPTTKLHTKGPYAGKSRYDKEAMKKVIGKQYADWI